MRLFTDPFSPHDCHYRPAGQPIHRFGGPVRVARTNSVRGDVFLREFSETAATLSWHALYLPTPGPRAASARMQIAAEDDCPENDLTSDMATAGPAGPRSLLEELDARQDEVLDELEKLNGRIDKVIAEWSAWRGDSGEKRPLPNAA